MEYNTQIKKLILPEYGRNIQNIVDHCLLIEDREERKKCASATIDIMGNMFPHLRDVNDFKHILWDHLAIMADFKLDIDYPYDVVKKDDLYKTPGRIEYSKLDIHYKHYGKIIDNMILIASEMEDGDKKDAFITVIIRQMKKSYLLWNKEVEDSKIIIDLYELSNHKISLDKDYIIPELKITSPKIKYKNQKNRRR